MTFTHRYHWGKGDGGATGIQKTEPAGIPLEKTSRIHYPSTIEQGKGKEPEYDPPQRIEEDRTLVNPE